MYAMVTERGHDPRIHTFYDAEHIAVRDGFVVVARMPNPITARCPEEPIWMIAADLVREAVLCRDAEVAEPVDALKGDQ